VNRFLEMAIDIAATSKCRYRHGCVVVANGVVVAEATNKKLRTADSNNWRIAHVHAEEAAIAAAGTRARGATVYVARVGRDGTPALSKPCKRCERRLARIGVAKVVWT
jgi:pyrimidine deaminase RibD-like protein